MVVVIALLMGLGHLRPVDDPDTPWHLQQAERVLAHGWPTYVDNTSFTAPGRTYVNHCWLGQFALLAVYQTTGFGGLSLFTAIMAAVAVLSIAWAAWTFSCGRPWLTVLVTSVVAAIVHWRISPRPLLFFMVFLPLGLVLGLRLARSAPGRAWRPGLMLLGLQAVWLPIHGSFVLLPATTVILLGGAYRAHGVRVALHRLVWPVAMFGLILLGNDITIHLRLIGDVALGDATTHIAEMRPMALHQLLPGRFNSILFLDLLLAIGVVRGALRRPIHVEHIALALLGMALAFTAHRFRAAWGILCIPIAAGSDRSDRAESSWMKRAAVAALVCVPLVNWNSEQRDPTRGFGLGLHTDGYPVDVAGYLEAIEAKGHLLNHYDDGGYLAFRLGPDVRIAIDGRTPGFFEEELFFQIRELQRNAHARARFEKTYAPDMILARRDQPLCEDLMGADHWQPAYAGVDRILFLRRGFRTDIDRLETIERCPFALPRSPSCVPGRREATRRDLRRLLAHTPAGVYGQIATSVFTAVCERDPSSATRWSAAALATGTGRHEVWLTHARALVAAGRPEDAIEVARQAEGLDKTTSSRVLRAWIERATGRTSDALDTLRPVVEELGDRLPVATRLEYAELLAEDGQWRAAKLQAERVLWVVSSTRARTLLNRVPPADGVAVPRRVDRPARSK